MTHRYTFFLVFVLPTAAFAQPPMDEVACYSFTGGAIDGSGNGHNGTVYGPVLTTDRFGTAGRAYSFDGTNDYIEVPDFSSFGITDEVSVGVWVRADNYTGNFAVSLWPDDFYDRFAAAPYYGHSTGCTVFWDFGDCTNGGRSSIIPYAFVSEWDHFTFTSSAANDRMRIYLNGSLIHEEFHHSGLTNVDRLLELGGGNIAGYSHWDGDLDEIVLYARELDEDEVADLFTYGAPCQYQVGVEEVAGGGPVFTVDASAELLLIQFSERTELQVLDAAGRLVATQQLAAGPQQWSTSGLRPGNYLARIQGAGGTWVHKLVVE